MPRVDAHPDVAGHDAPCNRGHAARHHRHQFRLRHSGNERFNDQRGFRHAHKHVSRGRQGLGPAGAHRLFHNLREHQDNPLHDADVIQERKQCRRKNYDRENLESDHHAKGFGVRGQRAEDKDRTRVGEPKHRCDPTTDGVEDNGAGARLQYEKSKTQLKCQAPANNAKINRLPVVGQPICGQQHKPEPASTDDVRHLSLACRFKLQN